MNAATPVANSILQSNEGDIDELDLLAEIETALTQSDTAPAPAAQTQSLQSILPTTLYKSTILDIDDDSDIDEQQAVPVPQRTNVATVTPTAHSAVSVPAPVPTTVQTYKRKRVDTTQYSSLEQKTIDEAKLEQEHKKLKRRNAAFVASLTTEQKERYAIHNNTAIDTAGIRKLLSATCGVARLGHQVPNMLADALKSGIMHLTETARELQQAALQQKHDADPNTLVNVYTQPVQPIEPIYYRLAYLKLQQEACLPPARHSRHRRRAPLFTS